jgi:hypothetical protein
LSEMLFVGSIEESRHCPPPQHHQKKLKAQHWSKS